MWRFLRGLRLYLACNSGITPKETDTTFDVFSYMQILMMNSSSARSLMYADSAHRQPVTCSGASGKNKFDTSRRPSVSQVQGGQNQRHMAAVECWQALSVPAEHCTTGTAQQNEVAEYTCQLRC